jgi:hypothetical protein
VLAANLKVARLLRSHHTLRFEQVSRFMLFRHLPPISTRATDRTKVTGEAWLIVIGAL